MNTDYIAGLFTRAAPLYDQIGPQVFMVLGQRLVEFTHIRRGEAVLDVAMGRGAVLMPAVQHVRPQGYAIGVDIASGMVRHLAADVKRLDLEPAAICQADAEHLAFSKAVFDHVLCGNAIFFFPEAVKEFYRVLRPGGHVGVTIIADGCFDWLWEAFSLYSPSEDSSAGEESTASADPDLDTVAGLSQLLRGAGFERVEVVEEATRFTYAREGDWWATMWTLGFRGKMEEMSEPVLAEFKSEIVRRLQAFKQADGIHILFRVLFAVGVK
jgi:SAM-dependent methyltransferase